MTSLPGGLSAERTPPLLRSVAAHGLTATTLTTWPSAPLDAEAWRGLCTQLSINRLWPLAARAVADGALPATDEQHDEVQDRAHHAVAGALVLDRELVRLDASLRPLGVDARVFKGVAFATLFYPDPSVRTYSDVDLLVRGEQFDRAVGHLLDLGGRRNHKPPRAGFNATVGKGEVLTMPGGHEIDLHRTLQPGPFGASVDMNDLFRAPMHLPIGDRAITTLSPTALFLVACYHAVLPWDARRLLPLRDVAQILDSGLADIDEAIAMAERWQGRIAVATAIVAAEELFELAPTGPAGRWARSYRPSARERRWLRSAHDQRPRAGLVQGAQTIGALSSNRLRVTFILSQVLHEERDPLRTRARRIARRLTQREYRNLP